VCVGDVGGYPNTVDASQQIPLSLSLSCGSNATRDVTVFRSSAFDMDAFFAKNISLFTRTHTHTLSLARATAVPIVRV